MYRRIVAWLSGGGKKLQREKLSHLPQKCDNFPVIIFSHCGKRSEKSAHACTAQFIFGYLYPNFFWNYPKNAHRGCKKGAQMCFFLTQNHGKTCMVLWTICKSVICNGKPVENSRRKQPLFTGLRAKNVIINLAGSKSVIIFPVVIFSCGNFFPL